MSLFVEVKLSYVPVGRSVGWLVGLSLFPKWREVTLSEDLFYIAIQQNAMCNIVILE